MKILVIDDLRTFKFEAEYARNIYMGYLRLKNEHWDEVWLDHDMGVTPDVSILTDQLEGQAYSGRIFDVGTFVIHTSNPDGRKRMGLALEKYYNIRVVNANDYV